MAHEHDFDAYERLRKTTPELEVEVYITVKLHKNGALSVEGPIGDTAFCKKMLEEAIFAIERQPRLGEIVVPEKDVDSKPKEMYIP